MIASAQPSGDPLRDGFLEPPESAKPLVFWQWMNGCVTKEGITSDLESFKRVGLGGVQQFLVGGSQATITDPSVEILNPKWNELMRFAIEEAARLGLSFGTHNCPGWSASGSPGVTPEDAMQKLVWTSREFEGPSQSEVLLERAAVDPEWNFYRDVAVMGLPIRETAVAADEVVDLTARMTPDGTLRWEVPAGRWQVLRFGATLTGATNGTAPISGQGLEVDKMSRPALERFYASYPQKLLELAPSHNGRTFSRIELDSYEAGLQTWTPEMFAEFERRRGYDLRPWLPVLADRIIDTQQHSERFRTDWQRTLGDLITENYYAYLGELIRRTPGLEFLLEPYATGHGEVFDSMEVSAAGDILMCEFWQEPATWGWDSVKPVASAAHTWGKRIVAAEAFTGQPQYAWRVAPFDLKRSGDRAFALGVNKMILHAAAHQPWPQWKPGMTMGWWGTHFGPGQTWWEHGGPEWIRYLSRCQFLLQQGQPVADLCFLVRGRVRPALPAGYDGDTMGERVLLERVVVRDGRLELPDGMSYRVLVLPDRREMSVPVARKLRELVLAGAVIIGPPPERAVGLEGYPRSDAEVAAIGKEIWGDLDGVARTEISVGRGRVFYGKKPGDVLSSLGVRPDFEAPAKLSWIHRKADGNDIYFIYNSQNESLTTDVTLRATNDEVELWHPDSARVEKTSALRSADGRTQLAVTLEPHGSRFIVLRPHVTQDAIAPVQFSPIVSSVEITGPWHVRYPSGRGAPASVDLMRLLSWSAHSDAGVRHFSGTATYVAHFKTPPDFVPGQNRVEIDLGQVEKIATVSINGRTFATLWKPPFRVDITDALSSGDNALEVHVTNLWPNRLIGDEREPDDAKWGEPEVFRFVKPVPTTGRRLMEIPGWVTDAVNRPSGNRVTFTTYDFFNGSDPLLPSGLLGPVMTDVSVSSKTERQQSPPRK
jgi:hypothetical protein